MTQPEPPPPSANGRPKPRVVSLPIKRELSPQHLEQLRASGLDDETVRLAELYTEPNARTCAQMLRRAKYSGGPALVFPFYVPGATEPHACRLRPTHPRIEKRRNGKSREVKYDQSSEAGSLVYFPPRVRARGGYGDVAQVCHWTEGEKKALAFDQLGLPCVGVTGAWNWSDSAERDATGGDRLHPLIREHVTIAGREHLICYDADAVEKKDVMHGAARLAGVLLAAGATCVRFVCPPLGGPKGIDDYLGAHGPDAMRALLATAEVMEAVDPKRPRPRIRAIKAFVDAPIHKEASLPDGFDLRDDGSLWRMAQTERQADVRVSRAPLFIQRQYVDHASGEGRAQVCYREGDAWVSREISQLAAGDSRTMVAELTPFCVPVTSSNASRTVEWLHDYEGLNAEFIAKVTSLSGVGWHHCDGRVFVLEDPMLAEGSTIEVVVNRGGQRKEIFALFKTHGTWEAHLAALRQAWAASPVCAAMICGALAAPLLEPLHVANFGVHLIGESSRGKTSILKFAASVYGDPTNPRWLAVWNATHVGTELRAAELCDLPQCYDEVGGGDPEQQQQMVYSIINGTGRTRGQRDATMRPTASWRTILLSTGEREIVDEATATGAQIRMVQLHVDGVGALSGSDIDTLCEVCTVNAGQFGRRWIQTLLDVNDWLAWREQLALYTAQFREEARDSLQGRVAGYFALLAVAEEMAAELGLCPRGSHVMWDLFRSVESRIAVEGVAERARRYVQDWVEHDPDGFPELMPATSGGEVGSPARPGIRIEGYRRIDGTVLLIPSRFREFCKKHGLAHSEVIRQWARRAWTDVEAGRGGKRVRLNGKQPRFVILLPLPEDLE